MNTNQQSPPVAIIGGGVVGVSVALALARQGVESIVLERREVPDDHPRAHVCNPRTMEIFRLWGVDEQVRAAGLPPAALGNFVWKTTIAGETLGEVAYKAHVEDHVQAREATTLCPEVSCAQDEVEAILRDRLEALTGSGVNYGCGVDEVVQLPSGEVELRVAGRTEPIRCRYAIAADGAGSRTREALGIRMEGPEQLARFLALYVDVDLSPWVGDHPAVLYWVVNSRIQAVFISMDGRSRYTFHVRTDASRADLENPSIEECEELVRAAVGSDSVEPEIRQVGSWVMSGQVADRYRVGNVFLAGDAAHRFPPTGGFGMNTGIQDAHNLAWKLAAVLEGWAPESLLDTYEPERRPVAEFVCARSVENFFRLEKLASWSPDPGPIVSRLEAGGEVAATERNRFRQEIGNQRDHFDKLALELGYIYGQGAFLPEESSPALPDERAPYRPEARPGARAPLVVLSSPDGGEAPSTDLFETEFVLLAAPDHGWAAAASAAAQAGLPIRCIEVGKDLLDPEGSWATAYEVGADGAVLVRPDGHVAARFREAPTDPAIALSDSLERVLGNAAVPERS